VPTVDVIYYREGSRVPIVEWLEMLAPKARVMCTRHLERLAHDGHELRRPLSDHLGRGIFELRVRHQRVNLRMLYFFHGTAIVVVTHGFAKQQALVPLHEMWLAIERRQRFNVDPQAHAFKPGG